MVAHIQHPRHHLAKRQDVVTGLAAPTADGIGGGVTVDQDQPVDTALAVDDSATTKAGFAPTSVPPFIATGGTPTLVTTTSTPTETVEAPSDTVVEAKAATSKSVISMGTVIGACLGAFAGAAILILIGLFIYKRSAPKRKTRNPLSPHSRNMHGDKSRAMTGQENWDKLDGSGDDKWEGQYQTKEATQMESVQPMEKLTMFKKSTPSVRTAYTTTEEMETPAFNLGPHPFAAYHPGLAQDMAREEGTPRPFLGRVDAGPALSWDSDGGSYLSLRNRLSGGAMSPSLELITPHITSISESHRWESAEVVDFDVPGQTNSNNPFIDGAENKRNNPFTSAPQPSTPSSIDKGKARDLTGSGPDPFADQEVMPIPQFTHTAASSLSSNDRAIRSLIAAMEFDTSPEDVESRLRIASMQPSIVSNASAYTSGGEEEDVTQSFPLPPGSQP